MALRHSHSPHINRSASSRARGSGTFHEDQWLASLSVNAQIITFEGALLLKMVCPCELISHDTTY